jgi:PAS domain S-box-containing protein
MQTPKIRVMLADDDAGLLSAIADTVRSAPDLEVVATAQNAQEVAERALASRPDVIVMDVKMPGGGGVAAAREVAQSLPDAKVVALSAHEDTASALLMLEAGAVAYVIKGAAEPEILDAIRRAHRDQMSLPAELGSSTFKGLVRELHERQESESVLRKREQRGAAILESVPDAMVIVGPQGTIEHVNTQTERIFGYQRGELVGQTVEALVPDRYRHVHEVQRTKVESQRYARPMDAGLHFLGRRKDGTEFPVDISLSAVETEDGGKTIAAIRDITRRTVADETQRKSEQLFRGLLDAAPDAMVVVDTNGTIQVVNAQTERLFGYARAELREQSVDVLLPERYRSAHLRHRVGYLSMPEARSMGAELELYGRRKDGTEFPVDISLSPMASESGVLVIAAIRDVTERHEAKKKLDESFEIAQRQRLFARLIAAQEEERLRIASDIHDDTIQAMTATSLRMQQLRRHLTEPGQIELLSRLEDAVRESITRLRRLMFDLRPASLDRSGLAAALRELLERLHEETHLTFTLENYLSSEPVGGIRTAVYRIAQEALVNVKKHAAASAVNVELRTVGAGCRVRIQDDGKGFDVEVTDSKSGHLGLVSMRERAQIAGGWWLVRCPAGGGTVVEFWLPFDAETAPLNGEPLAEKV